MDNIVFEIVDKTGRKIHLSKTQWTHIREEHPHVIETEDIENTLKINTVFKSGQVQQRIND